MQRKPISWILEYTSKLPKEEQIACLQANGGPAITTILKYAFDPNIRWLLPEGPAPYTPCEFPNLDNMLYSEIRRLYLFVEGGNDNLNPLKREAMFIDLLESLLPADAELVVAIKDKKLPYEGLTADTVLKAFPGLF